MTVSWTEILNQGLADGLVRERHAREVENGNRVSQKSHSLRLLTRVGCGWLHETEQCCQNQASPKIVLQMVPSAAGEGAFSAACPHLTSIP